MIPIDCRRLKFRNLNACAVSGTFGLKVNNFVHTKTETRVPDMTEVNVHHANVLLLLISDIGKMIISVTRVTMTRRCMTVTDPISLKEAFTTLVRQSPRITLYVRRTLIEYRMTSA